ncbi:hypothetical protein PMIN02_002610 [Paraphaeosphaeria minitans]
MLPPLSLILITVVSSVRAGVFLRKQCWHEHPLSAVNFQCSREAEVEYIQFPDAAISNGLIPDDQTRHGPWSYPPICTDVLPSVGSSLCVYTDTSFSHGRGISIFTTPDLAERTVVLLPFQNPEALQGINDFTGTWITQEIPDKGMGMFASRDLMVSEYLLNIVDHNIDKLKFKDKITAHTPALLAYLESDLSTAEREKFFKLAVSQLPEPTRAMYANTFQLEIEGHNHLAVFPETSRLNHDCAPNAQYYLEPTLLTHFVHIIRPVKKGEEITISYTSPLDLTYMRQHHLEQGFHFRCTCARCTDHERSDAYLQHIQDLQSVLNDWSPLPAGFPGPQLAEELLDIYRDEGLEGFMDVPYGFAALAYNAVGDEETAVEYARRAEELVLLKDGKWAPNLAMMKELLRDPRGHWSFGRRPGNLRHLSHPNWHPYPLRSPLLTLEADSAIPHASLLSSFAALSWHTQTLILNLTARDPSAFRAVIWAEFAMSDENTWGDVEHAHGAHASDVLKAFHTNAVGAHLGLHTALLNHSCRPNAYAGFKEGTGEVRVYALRDILEGEQICISHLEGSAFSEAMGLRRGILVLQRGFVCLCDACMDAEESANMEREARDENLRATLQWLIAKYRWNEARLIDNFGMKGHKGVDPGFAMFLVEVGEGIVEVLEKLGMATMETLEWHQKIIHWSLALRENKMADDWREKMLQVVRICVGEGSVMYCEMQREEIGANAVERENTTTDVSRMGHPKVMMADEPEVEDEDKEIPWGTYDESSEEEDNSKDEDYVN